LRVFVSISSSPRKGFHRDVHARAGPVIAGIGEDRQVLEEGAGSGQDELTGGGQVMGTARQHIGDHSGDAARSGQRLHVPGGLMCLAGVLGVDLLALLAGLLARAPVGGDQCAVLDEVGKPLRNGLVQGLAQCGCLRRSTSTASSLYR
jgi:hypothetical protein